MIRFWQDNKRERTKAKRQQPVVSFFLQGFARSACQLVVHERKVYTERKESGEHLIIPKDLAELATYVEKGKNVFFFTANWCGDCRYIKPQLPEIEADFPDFQFIEVDRDEYMDVAVEWNIFGIPSLVVIEDGKELGRLVNKDRKTKEEIEAFLTSVQSA